MLLEKAALPVVMKPTAAEAEALKVGSMLICHDSVTLGLSVLQLAYRNHRKSLSLGRLYKRFNLMYSWLVDLVNTKLSKV